nr:hypothetical protein [Bacteroidetes bacterium endosymbiont of Geopemphigus sp.]
MTKPAASGLVNISIFSSYILSRKPGYKVFISVPYGEFFINESSDAEMIYIDGGAGMAPMRSHLFHIFHTKKHREKFFGIKGTPSVNSFILKI